MLFTEKPRPRLDVLNFHLLDLNKASAHVLRLDEIDPLISGNKWFKLKEYGKEALNNNLSTIVTFGGAYSNHILATAAYCKAINLASVGLIRGEHSKNLSATLQEAMNYGMELHFIDRETYRKKTIPGFISDNYPGAYIINEGGYGFLGMQGASEILELPGAKDYTHICSAVGTGTTLAGLVNNSAPTQQIFGVSSLKNNLQLPSQINFLLPAEKQNRFTLLHDFHFGGYAKHNTELINFMNDWYRRTGIPSDIVYTGKMFFAFCKLLEENFFPEHSKILLVHTGGLQGNHSLKKGTLIF